MKLKRIDSDREVKDFQRMEIDINGIKYTLTERFGKLQIHAHSEELTVFPLCANEICVEGILK